MGVEHIKIRIEWLYSYDVPIVMCLHEGEVSGGCELCFSKKNKKTSDSSQTEARSSRERGRKEVQRTATAGNDDIISDRCSYITKYGRDGHGT